MVVFVFLHEKHVFLDVILWSFCVFLVYFMYMLFVFRPLYIVNLCKCTVVCVLVIFGCCVLGSFFGCFWGHFWVFCVHSRLRAGVYMCTWLVLTCFWSFLTCFWSFFDVFLFSVFTCFVYFGCFVPGLCVKAHPSWHIVF